MSHGPEEVIQQMIKLQQFTFVCAPQPVQWAGVTACDVEVSRARGRVPPAIAILCCTSLGTCYEFAPAGGAFYLFAKAPWGTGTEFVAEAIRNNLLIIPGNVFSDRDTHFRISYAAEHRTLERGVEVLRKLAGAEATTAFPKSPKWGDSSALALNDRARFVDSERHRVAGVEFAAPRRRTLGARRLDPSHPRTDLLQAVSEVSRNRAR